MEKRLSPIEKHYSRLLGSSVSDVITPIFRKAYGKVEVLIYVSPDMAHDFYLITTLGAGSNKVAHNVCGKKCGYEVFTCVSSQFPLFTEAGTAYITAELDYVLTNLACVGTALVNGVPVVEGTVFANAYLETGKVGSSVLSRLAVSQGYTANIVGKSGRIEQYFNARGKRLVFESERSDLEFLFMRPVYTAEYRALSLLGAVSRDLFALVDNMCEVLHIDAARALVPVLAKYDRFKGLRMRSNDSLAVQLGLEAEGVAKLESLLAGALGEFTGLDYSGADSKGVFVDLLDAKYIDAESEIYKQYGLGKAAIG